MQTLTEMLEGKSQPPPDPQQEKLEELMRIRHNLTHFREHGPVEQIDWNIKYVDERITDLIIKLYPKEITQ